MFPNLWELDIHARHQQAHIASELRNCSAIDQSGLWSRDRLSRLRRWLGTSLIQVGSSIAGHDASPGFPTARTWSDLARH